MNNYAVRVVTINLGIVLLTILSGWLLYMDTSSWVYSVTALLIPATLVPISWAWGIYSKSSKYYW